MIVKVNATDWNGLSASDQSSIQAIIANNFEGQTVAPDEAASLRLSNNPACDAACNVAETAAVAACNALPFPASLVCVAAAHEAGNFCRSRC